MAELLLPTQQVHLNGGNAHGVQSRFHSPTPDKSIAFQVDPNRNITMMKDAVEAITKHLEDDIWELRPGSNRVLYFFHKDDTYVLLHQFRKKTQKTPRREIDKAKAERDDWIARKG